MYATLVAVMALTASQAAPELIVDVDINDEVYGRAETLTVEDIDTLVKHLHENGCVTLLIRAGYLGLLPYHTDLSYPMAFDEDHARIHQFAMLRDVDAYIAKRKEVIGRYAEAMSKYDPVEEFVNAAHKYGMKAVVWIDIFDNYYPGYRSKFLDEHPKCRWTARDGVTKFPGLISYAYPEARAFCVAQARELLALGADGIHCSTSAHCRHVPNSHKVDFYGYEQPVVDAFKARYGVDIRTAEDFDKEAWHDVKGEFMVQLYRDLAQLCHGQGKELWVGLQLGRYTQFCVDSHFSDHAVARYANHWKTLVDEGIADAFILADYELATQANSPYWALKTDIKLNEGENLHQWAARHYQPYCKGKTRLYTFTEWLPGKPQDLQARMDMWARHTVDNGFDGVDVHEAWNFEFDPAKMQVLGRFAKQLAGEPVE